MSELLDLLNTFIVQAHEGKSQTKKEYPTDYHGLTVEVSFGYGNRADVAWLSFVSPGEGAQQEHFPSFYYDWRNSLLFLVLGVSESADPETNWSQELLSKYPDFASTDDSEIVAKRYPKSHRYARYEIDPGNIRKSLEDQIAAIEDGLSFLLKEYTHPDGPRKTTHPTLPEILDPYILRFKENYPELEEETGLVDEETGKVLMTGSALRESMKNRVQTAFSRERIGSLKKDEAIEILSGFWAVKYGKGGGGGGTDENGNYIAAIEIVQQGFIEKSEDLLYGEGPFEARYARFIQIKGLKHGIASEFLCYYDPEEYGIVNTPSEKALNIFGIGQRSPTIGSKSGEDALAFFGKLKYVLSVLRRDPSFAGADLLILDYFLYSVNRAQFWRIAGGKNGGRWEDGTWHRMGIASLGSTGLEQELGSRILTATESELRAAYQNTFPKKSANNRNETARLLTAFLQKVNIGDVLVVNKGTTAVLGYGIVTSGPKYADAPSDEDFRVYRNVLWVRTGDSIPVPVELKKYFIQAITWLKYKTFLQLFPQSAISERKYWKIAPGEGAIFEQLWYDRSIISVGWNEFQDHFDQLRSCPERQQFQSACQEIIDEHVASGDPTFAAYSSHRKIQASSDLFWRFFHGISIGDLVVVNRGINEIIAIGEVISDIYVDTSMDDGSVRDVEWWYTGLSIQKPEGVRGNWHNSIEELKADDFKRIMDVVTMQPEPVETALDRKMRDLLNHKKQIILYGPPGTGKTYHANTFVSRNRSETYSITERSLPNQRLFILVSFKEKYGHLLDLDAGDHFTYDWKGRHNWQRYYDELQEGDIALVYSSRPLHRFFLAARCVEKGQESLEFEVIQRFSGASYSQMKEAPELADSIMMQTMSFSLLRISEQEFRHILALSEDISYATLGLEEDTFIEAVPIKEFVTFHPSFGYEDFIEGLRPVTTEEGTLTYRVEEGVFKTFSRTAFNVLLKKAEIEKEWTDSSGIPVLNDDEKNKVREWATRVPFYLVIDEINRGDISRIFGELITLLEADKRYCEENELTTTLPYSKQRFSIPPNLFLIGTMNTADRSISLVDVALRRRFGFIELMPDYEVLRMIIQNPSYQEISDLAVRLLKQINRKITANYDRDHQIGHSYLTKLNKAETREHAIELLHFAWYHEIIPLLQEYFYDAPPKLKDILGKKFVKVRDGDRSFEFLEPLEQGAFLDAITSLIHDDGAITVSPDTE